MLQHKHLFNGPFSGNTQVSRYQKGKTNLDFTEANDSEWQWHQLGHMQVCKLLQTDNNTSTPPLCFLQAGCPSCRPNNSVKALKANGCATKCTKIHFSAWVCPGPPLGSYDTIPDLRADWRGGYPLTSLIAFGVSVSGAVFLKYDHLATLHAYGLHKYFKQVL